MGQYQVEGASSFSALHHLHIVKKAMLVCLSADHVAPVHSTRASSIRKCNTFFKKVWSSENDLSLLGSYCRRNEGSLPPELGKNLSNTSNVTTRKECTLGILGEDRDVGK